jgi:hypothetical protein
MKRIVLGLVLGVALGVAVGPMFLRRHAQTREGSGKEKGEEKSHDSSKDSEKEKEKEKDKDGALHLSQAEQAEVGLTVIEPAAVERSPEHKAYGRVLDASSLAGLLTDIQAARAAAKASGREYERLKILKEQGDNASVRALETAEALAQRDAALLEAAEGRLVSGWGRALTGRPGLAELSRELLSQRMALLRVDLLPGEILERAPTKFRATFLAGEGSAWEAEWLGPAPNADPQAQGTAFLALLPTNPPPPGTALVAYLPAGGAAQKGVLLPRQTVVRHDGETFVYVRTGAETFERRRVELGRAEAGGYLVLGGLKAGEKVVDTGAQQLLSAELKAGGGEE